MEQYAFGDRNCPPIPDIPSLLRNQQSGIYFRHNITLPAGSYTALVQTQLHQRTSDAEIRVSAATGIDDNFIACTTQQLTGDGTDRTLLSFDLPEDGLCEIRGWVDRDCYGTLLRFLTIVPGYIEDPYDPRFWSAPEAPSGELIDIIIMGTTTKCPASCLSCPTNKPVRQAIPKGVMPMPLFNQIADDLAEIGFTGGIIFGLYGEPMMDPHFPQRIRKIREVMPKVAILLATTGSIYEEELHGAIVDLVDGIAIHMEAINVDTYDAMMHPLKAGRAFPRIDALLKRSRDKSHIVMPMGRSNISEIAPITTYSREMGIRSPDFASLSNRCGVSPTFDTESIAPVATCCSAKKVASELIIDWDGTVVACCFDFLRLGKISNLSQVRLADYLKGAQRREFLEAFNQKEWHKLPACRSCRIDDTLQTELIVKSVTAVQSNVIRLNARKFTFAEDMTPKDGDMFLSGDAAKAVEPTPPNVSVQISHGAAIAVVEEPRQPVSVNRVWGPYQLLPKGAYTAQLHLDSLVWGYRSQIFCEIIIDETVVDARVFTEASVEQLLSSLFFRTVQDGTLQIRLATLGVDFRFKGVTVVAQRN